MSDLQLLTRKIVERTLTKVITTISPAHHDKEILRKLLLSGTSILRINLSHFKAHCRAANDEQQKQWEGQKETWRDIFDTLFEVQRELGVEVGLMIDTCGPEFRVRLEGETQALTLEKGQTVLLDIVTSDSPDPEPVDSGEVQIAVLGPNDFRGFSSNDEEGDVQLVRIADGELSLEILDRDHRRIRARALNSGSLENGKSVNLPGLRILAQPVSRRDLQDLKFFLNLEDPKTGAPYPIDFVAQSFIRSAADVERLRNDLKKLCKPTHDREDSLPAVVAKFETHEATQDPRIVDSIVKASDGVMIARGDLANQSERYKVPEIQRTIIRSAHSERKPVIVATGVYRGLVTHSEPTRAEVENVRSALEWGVDAFMLSDETATRNDPHVVIDRISDQIEFDEERLEAKDHFKGWREEVRERFEKEYHQFMQGTGRATQPVVERDYRRRDMALAAAYRVSNRQAAGVFVQSVTGKTVRETAHFLPNAPIYMVTDDPGIGRRHLLYRGVRPIALLFDPEVFQTVDMRQLVWRLTDELDICNDPDDFLLATSGHPVSDTLFVMGVWERDLV